MTVQLVGNPRPNGKAMLGLVPVALLVLTAGMLMGAPSGDVPPAYAALCQSSHGCVRNYLHAVMNVQHVDTSTPPGPVQPNTGESLSITAYWNTMPPGPCYEVSETATADVDWNGSAFVLSNVNLPAHIAALYLCSGTAPAARSIPTPTTTRSSPRSPTPTLASTATTSARSCSPRQRLTTATFWTTTPAPRAAR